MEIQHGIALGHPAPRSWTPSLRGVFAGRVLWVTLGVLMAEFLMRHYIGITVAWAYVAAGVVRVFQLARATVQAPVSPRSMVNHARFDHLHAFMAHLQPWLMPAEVVRVHSAPQDARSRRAHTLLDIRGALRERLTLWVSWHQDADSSAWVLRASIDVLNTLDLTPRWPVNLPSEPHLGVIDLEHAQWARQQWTLTFSVPPEVLFPERVAARVMGAFAAAAVQDGVGAAGPVAALRLVDRQNKAWPEPSPAATMLAAVDQPSVGGPADHRSALRRQWLIATSDMPLYAVVTLLPWALWSQAYVSAVGVWVGLIAWGLCGILVAGQHGGFFPLRPRRDWRMFEFARYRLDGSVIYDEGEALIDLDEPFRVALSRASDGSRLNVVLRSETGERRFAFGVAVRDDERLSELPIYDVVGPQFSARSVGGEFWSTLQFYVAAHGGEATQDLILD